MQKIHNTSALSMELRLFCTKPFIWCLLKMASWPHWSRSSVHTMAMWEMIRAFIKTTLAIMRDMGCTIGDWNLKIVLKFYKAFWQHFESPADKMYLKFLNNMKIFIDPVSQLPSLTKGDHKTPISIVNVESLGMHILSALCHITSVFAAIPCQQQAETHKHVTISQN